MRFSWNGIVKEILGIDESRIPRKCGNSRLRLESERSNPRRSKGTMHLPAGMEWVIILLVVLLLFGPSKLPQLAKGLGQSVKEFKDAAKTEDEKVAEAKAVLAKAEKDAAEAKAKAAEGQKGA
jgi:sec-independent protein translocase protein TatA